MQKGREKGGRREGDTAISPLSPGRLVLRASSLAVLGACCSVREQARTPVPVWLLLRAGCVAKDSHIPSLSLTFPCQVTKDSKDCHRPQVGSV